MMDPYAELAHAILVWDLTNREGTRRQQIDAERQLSTIARDLNAQGYTVNWKKDATP